MSHSDHRPAADGRDIVKKVLCATALLLSAALSNPVNARTDWSAAAQNAPPDSTQPVIDRVELSAENVFSAERERRWWVYRFLNKIHIPTRESVLSRETLLSPGVRFDPRLAYETERNLRGLGFIYDAVVRLDSLADTVVLSVQTIDKWTLNGSADFRRNAGQNSVTVGIEESNLLGLGHEVSFDYVFSDIDPSFFQAVYTNPRLFNKPLSAWLEHRSDPLNKTSRIRLRRPYVRRADNYSGHVEWRSFDTRILRIRDGDTAASFFDNGDRCEIGGGRRFGDYDTKLSIDANYTYLEQRVANKQIIDTPAIEFPLDSVYQRLFVMIALTNNQFYRTRRIDYQARTEDVTLTRGVSLQLAQTRGAGFGPLLHNSVGVILNYDFRHGDFIQFNQLSRVGWFDNGTEFRTLTEASAGAFHNGLSWVTFAGRMRFVHDRRTVDHDPLALDEDRGVRGYPRYYLTGDRAVQGSFEARLHTGISALTTRLGLVTHFDFGNAWRSGETLRLGEFIWSAGAGLRIDLAQIGGGRVARLDLSYAGDLGSWELSSGIGQYFELF